MSKNKDMAPPCSTLGETDLKPARPLLVYLDLNKWIDLAHAKNHTKRGQQFENALQIIEQSVSDGDAVFPLSFAHFMEVAKIGDDDQRGTLAGLMANLSQGQFLASASSLTVPELRTAIASRFKRPLDDRSRWALTRSLKKVFVNAEEMKSLGDIDDSLFQYPVLLERFLYTARVSSAFVSTWTHIAENHENTRMLRWEASKAVRKRAYCATLTFGIKDRLVATLAEFGLSTSVLDELGPEGCVALLESVPFFDVEINLHVERNEHRDRAIQANDEIDLAFLSLAIPYCHVVVTEKFWTSLVRRLRLDEKYRSFVGADLNEILPILRPTVG